MELRPARSSDALRIAGAATDEIARSSGLESAESMRAGAPSWVASARDLALRGEAFRYLVYRSGRFAGSIEVRSDVVRGHVGYWLRRAERGQGTATFAVRMIVPVAFEGMGLRAVDFEAESANARSIGVMRRVGARLVAEVSASERSSGSVRYRLRRRGYRATSDAPAKLADLIT